MRGDERRIGDEKETKCRKEKRRKMRRESAEGGVIGIACKMGGWIERLVVLVLLVSGKKNSPCLLLPFSRIY